MQTESTPALAGPARSAFVLISVATGLAIMSVLQSAIWFDYRGQTVPWLGLLKARLGEWYIYALFIPPLLIAARRAPITTATLSRVLPLYLGASLALPIVKEAMFVALGNWFRPGVFHIVEILAEDYVSEVFTFWAMIAVVHVVSATRSSDSAPRLHAPVPTLAVRDGALRRDIAVDLVAWIDAQGNYARLHTETGRYLVRQTMSDLERMLAPSFVRAHRRALVNVTSIVHVERRTRGGLALVLRCGSVIPVGRAYRAAILGRLH